MSVLLMLSMSSCLRIWQVIGSDCFIGRWANLLHNHSLEGGGGTRDASGLAVDTQSRQITKAVRDQLAIHNSWFVIVIIESRVIVTGLWSWLLAPIMWPLLTALWFPLNPLKVIICPLLSFVHYLKLSIFCPFLLRLWSNDRKSKTYCGFVKQ